MPNSYLLDTHCLIWFHENNPKIPSRVLDIIQNPENIILFSQVSLYEIAIKQKIGKLPDFKSDIIEIHQQAIKDNFTFIQLQNKHLSSYSKVPLHDHHRDPFDRLLIATAYEEEATMVTVDNNFELYRNFISILW